MCVNSLPKVATQWNSGATRDSNRGPWVRIPSALTTEPLSQTKCVLRSNLTTVRLNADCRNTEISSEVFRKCILPLNLQESLYFPRLSTGFRSRRSQTFQLVGRGSLFVAVVNRLRFIHTVYHKNSSGRPNGAFRRSYVLLLMFLFYFWHFGAPYLRGALADCHEIFRHDLKCVHLDDVRLGIWESLPPKI